MFKKIIRFIFPTIKLKEDVEILEKAVIDLAKLVNVETENREITECAIVDLAKLMGGEK